MCGGDRYEHRRYSCLRKTRKELEIVARSLSYMLRTWTGEKRIEYLIVRPCYFHPVELPRFEGSEVTRGKGDRGFTLYFFTFFIDEKLKKVDMLVLCDDNKGR